MLAASLTRPPLAPTWRSGRTIGVLDERRDPMHADRRNHESRSTPAMPHVHGRAADRRRLTIAFGIALALVIVEVVGGIAANSLAVLADAGHVLTDVTGIGLSLAAMWIAGRPATDGRTFGYYRAEYPRRGRERGPSGRGRGVHPGLGDRPPRRSARGPGRTDARLGRRRPRRERGDGRAAATVGGGLAQRPRRVPGGPGRPLRAPSR